jgi:hypothetical protein
MLLLLPFMRESPRWLAYRGRIDEALANLAWTRKRNIDDPAVVEEFNEICAAIQEDKENMTGASWSLALKPGNRIRMFIAFAMFFLQQWSGQNSINYYVRSLARFIHAFVADLLSFALAGSHHLQVDRHHRRLNRPPLIGHLRHRQDRRDLVLHLPRHREDWPQVGAGLWRVRHVALPLDHRRHLQLAPAQPEGGRDCSLVDRDGRHDLPLRHPLLLLVGTRPLGLLVRTPTLPSLCSLAVD